MVTPSKNENSLIIYSPLCWWSGVGGLFVRAESHWWVLCNKTSQKHNMSPCCSCGVIQVSTSPDFKLKATSFPRVFNPKSPLIFTIRLIPWFTFTCTLIWSEHFLLVVQVDEIYSVPDVGTVVGGTLYRWGNSWFTSGSFHVSLTRITCDREKEIFRNKVEIF